MTTKSGPPLKLRGSCTAGHVVETTAEPGKVTRRLQCTAVGCDLPITARRVPVAQQAGQPAKVTADPPADDPRTLRVKKVTTYRDDPAAYEAPPAQDDPGPAGPDDPDDHGGPAGLQPPATEPDGPAIPGADGSAGAGDGRRRPWGRRERPRRASGQLYPGIY